LEFDRAQGCSQRNSRWVIAFESVGEGRSVGSQPNYAAEYGQIQQGLAHRFDEFTNPFLFAQNVNKSVLPWIENKQENAYRQGMLDIDRQKQNLAQTAQDTLLPLQANMLGAQASNLAAEGSARAYELSRAQNADASAPEFFQSFGRAIVNGDKTAAYDAIAQNPQVAAKFAPQIQSGMNDLDKNSIIRQGVGIQSATQQGADAAATSRFSNPEEYSASLAPLPNENPVDFQLRQSAAQQGFAQKHAQLQQIQAQNAAKITLAQIQAGGRVDSSTVRTIGDLIKNGNMSPDELGAVRPGLAAWAAAHPGQEFNGPQGAMASAYPKETQKEVMANYTATMISPNASQDARDSATAMLHKVFPAFAAQDGAAPQYDPVSNAQLKALDLAEKGAQLGLSKALQDPKGRETPWGGIFGGKSPYQEAIDTINRINIERADILKNSPAPRAANNIPVITLNSTLAVTNPLTAAAEKKEKTSPTETPIQMAPIDQKALEWARSHPDDPRSAQWIEQIQAKYGK